MKKFVTHYKYYWGDSEPENITRIVYGKDWDSVQEEVNMSRETLKAKIIEVLKEVEANQISYIVQHNVCGCLSDVDVDDGTIGFGKDVLRKRRTS